MFYIIRVVEVEKNKHCLIKSFAFQEKFYFLFMNYIWLVHDPFIGEVLNGHHEPNMLADIGAKFVSEKKKEFTLLVFIYTGFITNQQ